MTRMASSPHLPIISPSAKTDMRLDKYLTEQGYAESRTRSARLIESGKVKVDGKIVTKPAFEVSDGAEISVEADDCPYVSRGGLKLEGALRQFNLNPDGMVCADVGASTGGFTHCLLSLGASRVYAIDSGSDQLHPTLRNDPRVISMEGCNARYLTPEQLGEQVDLVVTDVSFISQTLLHGVIASLLKDGGGFVSLIKPQFEVGRENLGKGGIVKDPKVRRASARRVMASAMSAGLAPVAIAPSPITGGDGNIEYLAHFIKQPVSGILPETDHLP